MTQEMIKDYIENQNQEKSDDIPKIEEWVSITNFSRHRPEAFELA